MVQFLQKKVNEERVDYAQIYRGLINDMNLFDFMEKDQIVEAAQSEAFPIVSAKNWAICDPKKGEFINGKEHLL